LKKLGLPVRRDREGVSKTMTSIEDSARRPLAAVTVILYVSPDPVIGVPERVKLPSLLSTKATPPGRLPVKEKEGFGEPKAK
jgi:hypothetical protein